MTTYNINELLDKKKALEKQLESYSKVDARELIYSKEVFTDHTNDDKEKTIEQRQRISLNDYSKKLNTALKELEAINIAIAKFNAENVVELLQQREGCRRKISFLNLILDSMPKNRTHQRGVSRQHEGKALESVEMISEPMFSVDEVEKQLNEASAQERKLNTNIQRLNLNAEIEL